MRCPVLTELDLTEAHNPEHENAPILSGGDYDIAAIRSCAVDCPLVARRWSEECRVLRERERLLRAGLESVRDETDTDAATFRAIAEDALANVYGEVE